MNIVYDDFLNSDAKFLICTTSNSFDKNGKLVMGKGAALAFKNKFQNVVTVFSYLVKQKMSPDGYYGLILNGDLGIFQVKYSFKDPANLELIRKSTLELIKFSKSHRDWTFAMNFPGIGAGNLSIDSVMPIVSKLPNNVSLYIKE